MHQKLDLRGLAPPEPVVRVKKALAAADDMALDVLVDAGPAMEDILHFAAFKKHQAEVVSQTAGAVRLKIVKGNPPPEKPEEAEEKPPRAETPREEPAAHAARPAPPPAVGSVLVITGEGVGEDNRRLARAILIHLLQAAAEDGRRPAKVVLLNSGVALACEGSEVLQTLKKLADGGAEVLVSAESLDFLGLRPRLAAGAAANAAQVAQALFSGAQVIRL